MTLSLSVITTIIVICYIKDITVRISQTNGGWTLMKPSKAQQWWDWAWLQQLAPSNFIKISLLSNWTFFVYQFSEVAQLLRNRIH